MQPIPLPYPSSPGDEAFFTKLFGLAQGSILQLSADSGEELQPGQIGYFGTKVYIFTQDGGRIVLSGSSWS